MAVTAPTAPAAFEPFVFARLGADQALQAPTLALHGKDFIRESLQVFGLGCHQGHAYARGGTGEQCFDLGLRQPVTTDPAQLRPGRIGIRRNRLRRAVTGQQPQATDRLQAHDRLEFRPAQRQQGLDAIACLLFATNSHRR